MVKYFIFCQNQIYSKHQLLQNLFKCYSTNLYTSLRIVSYHAFSVSNSSWLVIGSRYILYSDLTTFCIQIWLHFLFRSDYILYSDLATFCIQIWLHFVFRSRYILYSDLATFCIQIWLHFVFRSGYILCSDLATFCFQIWLHFVFGSC